MEKREKPRKETVYSAFKIILKVVLSVFAIAFAITIMIIIRNFSWQYVKEDNLNIHYNKMSRECFAAHYEWDGNPENMTITVPDECDGLKVKSLGGFTAAPTLFYVMVPDKMHPEAVSVAEDIKHIGTIDKNTVTYTFTVKLGKNIRDPERFTYKEYYMDDSGKVIYIVEMNYESSPENKWIYSENGKLYDKKTNKLIE